MRLRRRLRIFVSFSHDDEALRDVLIEWLQRNGCEVQSDNRLRSGDRLELIQPMIDWCDALLEVGTESFMASNWCESEVIHAGRKGKYLLPVLFKPVARIQPWFHGVGANATRHAECYDGNFAELKAMLDRRRDRAPAELALAVALLFFFLFGVPILGSWTIRHWIGRADKEIRELQGWVEDLNRDLAEGRRYVKVCQGREILYRDPAVGELVARDTLQDGRVERRLFYRAGKEVAADSILFEQIHGDEPSLSKRREIYPQGRATGVLIEETFDSVGNLVTKRLRQRDGAGSISYADVGLSVYPPLLPFCPYR
jgi:hypothetical protein